ncbi:hypothetical protein LEN26_009076, partial [Aphanomyces euteiches]
MSLSIIIVGAGVIGLTTALQLVLDGVPASQITIVSKDKPEDTTSFVAGALWECPPYHMERSANALKWCKATLDKCIQIMKDYPDCGMHVVPNITVSQQPLKPNTDAQTIASSYRESSDLTSPDTRQFLHSHGAVELQHYKHMQSYDVVIADMGLYLAWLVKQLQRHGVQFEMRDIQDLHALASRGNVVVNCTGLYREDPDMYPCKGQVVLVHAPWIRSSICDEDVGAYMIPRPCGNLICGGTSEKNVWNTDVEAHASRQILKKCFDVVPSLRRAKFVGARAGLRPERRGGVRVEIDPQSSGGFLVHHY